MQIAITGGIGSGKSTVAKIIAERYQVVDCDKLAGDVLAETETINELIDVFGSDIICCGQINKRVLSQKGFNSPSAVGKLNSIMHPKIIKKMYEAAQGYDIIFFEVPLLFESEQQQTFDKIILVTASDEDRISRVIRRSNLTREQVQARIALQFPDTQKKDRCHYVIENNGDINDLRAKTMRVMGEIGEVLNGEN